MRCDVAKETAEKRAEKNKEMSDFVINIDLTYLKINVICVQVSIVFGVLNEINTNRNAEKTLQEMSQLVHSMEVFSYNFLNLWIVIIKSVT